MKGKMWSTARGESWAPRTNAPRHAELQSGTHGNFEEP